jgi:hypothetical protein
MDMEIGGRLGGGAAKVGTYDYISGDMKVSVVDDRVSVTWIGCPDGSDETEKALQEWFDAELAAQVLATGVPSSVHWTGRTLFENGEQVGLRLTMTNPFGYVRDHPQQLSVYSSAADAIRRYPEVALAVEHFRATARLMRGSEDIALGEAYLTVALLVAEIKGDERQSDWRAFGEALRAACEAVDGDDLEQLYASCQWGRHHRQSVATKTLTRIGRPKLSWYESCWRAAEIIEAYVRAKDAGAI